MGTELVPVGDDSPFALLRMDAGDAQELLADALGGDALSFKDLDRVKVPSGGGTMWTVPTLHGEEGKKFVEGVIIERATRRAYWPYALEDKPDDADGKPECQSFDGVMGIGDPGGDCSACPFNEFDTDVKGGPGKACKETRQLFVLTKDDLLPLVLTVPPGSLANVKAYLLRLLRAQLTVDSVVTKIGLEKVTGGKTPFSRVTFEAAEKLTPEARQRTKAYSAILAPMMERAAAIQQSEVSD